MLFMAATNEPTLVDVAEIGRKGGKARAKKMTAGQRSESARNAVLARWAKEKAGKEVAAQRGSKKRAKKMADE